MVGPYIFNAWSGQDAIPPQVCIRLKVFVLPGLDHTISGWRGCPAIIPFLPFWAVVRFMCNQICCRNSMIARPYVCTGRQRYRCVCVAWDTTTQPHISPSKRKLLPPYFFLITMPWLSSQSCLRSVNNRTCPSPMDLPRHEDRLWSAIWAQVRCGIREDENLYAVHDK